MSDLSGYEHIRSGGAGFYEQKRGLISVWGKEAVQFLDGMITNNMKTLADGGQMLAAFPNVQGRLVAVVRVLRQGDRFLFETEDATREKVFQNLLRFTLAGDFFVEDLSERNRYFELFGLGDAPSLSVGLPTQAEAPALAGGFLLHSSASTDQFISLDLADSFREERINKGAVEIADDLYETLRIENGVPKYGVDMDETTIVPELGLNDMISYTKGCYVGQEIIARIHFRGHVAKQLTGLVVSEPPASTGGFLPGAELTSADGKNAGRITSVTYSHKLEKTIALAFVRYDYLPDDTTLLADGLKATVKSLPFL